MLNKRKISVILSLASLFMIIFGFPAFASDSEMQAGGSLDGKTLYLVETEDQLRSIGTGQYGMDQAYMMSKDIVLTGEWILIGTKETPFTGVFWGNGCSITNLKITNPDAEIAGIFGYAKDASIYNVTFIDIDSAGANMDEKFINAPCAVPENCEIFDIFIK